MTAAKPIHPVTMPKWGIEMTEGTLSEWTAREGQSVSKGDPLLEVETDKIINTVEAPASGVLRRIVAPVGEVRAVGTLIAVLADESVSEDELTSFIDGFKGASVSFEPEGADATPAAAPVEAGGDEPRVSPIARRLAEKLGIDVGKIQGTGRNGRVSKEDVEAYAAKVAAAGQSAGPGATGSNPSTRTKLSAMRATIARRLSESKQTIPHYRVQMDIDVGNLQSRRKELATQHGVKISLNDMLVSCAARALMRHPLLNAHFEGDEIVQYQHADIAMAVATEGGLITPVVRAAEQKSPADIARMTADLADKARRGALTREDITGGTFSISNLGMFGLTSFDAIINPPQVGILSAGAAQDRVIVRNGSPAVAQMLTLTLSADHRVVDGAVGAAFLGTVRDLAQA